MLAPTRVDNRQQAAYLRFFVKRVEERDVERFVNPLFFVPARHRSASRRVHLLVCGIGFLLDAPALGPPGAQIHTTLAKELRREHIESAGRDAARIERTEHDEGGGRFRDCDRPVLDVAELCEEERSLRSARPAGRPYLGRVGASETGA